MGGENPPGLQVRQGEGIALGTDQLEQMIGGQPEGGVVAVGVDAHRLLASSAWSSTTCT